MAERLDYYFRQRVTEAELELGFELLERADRNLAADIGVYRIVSDAEPTPHSTVADLTIDLTAPPRPKSRYFCAIWIAQDGSCSRGPTARTVERPNLLGHRQRARHASERGLEAPGRTWQKGRGSLHPPGESRVLRGGGPSIMTMRVDACCGWYGSAPETALEAARRCAIDGRDPSQDRWPTVPDARYGRASSNLSKEKPHHDRIARGRQQCLGQPGWPDRADHG
jgi:hypothetical protein